MYRALFLVLVPEEHILIRRKGFLLPHLKLLRRYADDSV
jgi:hypothetical protein